MSHTHTPETGGRQLPATVQRLGTIERALHGIFVLAFMILVVTGLLLILPDETIVRVGDLGINVAKARQGVHRAAGAVMVICSLIHVVHVILSRRGHRFLADIFPRKHDATDILQSVLWMLGLRPEPRFRRFSYKQKAEYFALVAGSAIVCATGIILWTSPQWSKFSVDLSKLIHSLEATLAACAIVVWHFYEVHFRRGKFLSNHTWIDGRMSTEELRHDHAREFDRVFGEVPDPAAVREALTPGRSAPRAVVYVLNALGIFLMAGVVAGGVWLARIHYFPEPGVGLPLAPGEGGTSGVLPAKRFHHRPSVGLAEAPPDAPACLKCHGYLSHAKAKESAVNSMLNLHERTLDCVVCHVPVADVDKPRTFRWLAAETRAPLDAQPARGPDGMPRAAIYAMRGATIVEEVPDGPATQRLARGVVDTLTPGEKAAAVKEVHGKLAEAAIDCERCHRASPYLDLAALGYEKARIDVLTGARIYPIVKGKGKGGDFFFPDFLTPGGSPSAAPSAPSSAGPF